MEEQHNLQELGGVEHALAEDTTLERILGGMSLTEFVLAPDPDRDACAADLAAHVDYAPSDSASWSSHTPPYAG